MALARLKQYTYTALRLGVARLDHHLMRFRASSWQQPLEFAFRGRTYPMFCHRFNCGYPPGRGTERAVELGLADAWLKLPQHASSCEVGAVTPYYWPGRIATVIDPADPHPAVTERISVLDADLRGRSVLSISTVEHVGHSDYGLPVGDERPADAVRKIVGEAQAYLITFPIGYDAGLDDWVRSSEPRELGAVPTFLVRERDWEWREEPDRERSRVTYGPLWANGITVFWKAPDADG